MKTNKFILILTIVICLLYAIFYPEKDDMTLRFSIILVANSLQGFLYDDIKLRKINAIISLVIMIIVIILGFGFDYFKL